MLNRLKFDILFVLTIVCLISFLYSNYVVVPSLKEKISYYENTPPKVIERVVTKIDTLTIIDTLEVRVPFIIEKPVLITPTPSDKEVDISNYQTVFADTLIKGTIYTSIQGPGSLVFTNISYKPVNPLLSYLKVDSIFITKTVTLPPERITVSNSSGLYIGAAAGASPSVLDPRIGFGPAFSIANKRGSMFTYKYDLLNNQH